MYRICFRGIAELKQWLFRFDLAVALETVSKIVFVVFEIIATAWFQKNRRNYTIYKKLLYNAAVIQL